VTSAKAAQAGHTPVCDGPDCFDTNRFAEAADAPSQTVALSRSHHQPGQVTEPLRIPADKPQKCESREVHVQAGVKPQLRVFRHLGALVPGQ